MPAIHFEFTEYYYPDGKDFPSKIHIDTEKYVNLVCNFHLYEA